MSGALEVDGVDGVDGVVQRSRGHVPPVPDPRT